MIEFLNRRIIDKVDTWNFYGICRNFRSMVVFP